MTGNRVPASVWRNPWHFLAFGCGSGAAPLAPGTFGTLAAVPLYLLLEDVAPPLYLLAVAAMFVFGVWLCGRTAHDIGVHDHAGIVWDEIVGYLVTMLYAPAGWPWVVAGFALFRLFDIWKPWPIRLIDRRVRGGTGIMLDDLIAGIYAALVLMVLVRFVGQV